MAAEGCFIAQQAAEKALKALLYFGGARTVVGHSVLDLLERARLTQPALDRLRDDARRLNRFYIPTRYPDALPGGSPFESFTRQDLEQALAMAERILSAAGALVKPDE